MQMEVVVKRGRKGKGGGRKMLIVSCLNGVRRARGCYCRAEVGNVHIFMRVGEIDNYYI